MNVLFFPLGYLSFIDEFYQTNKELFSSFKWELFEKNLSLDVTNLFLCEEKENSNDNFFNNEKYFIKKDSKVFDVIFECGANKRTDLTFYQICKKYFDMINFTNYVYIEQKNKELYIDDDTLEEQLI